MRKVLPMPSAQDIINQLELQPHPEGGHYRETFRDVSGAGGRSFSTAILFLLKRGEVSRWHRVDAVEIWHWYAGAPLWLGRASEKGAPVEELTLGNDVMQGQSPQIVIPAHHWQSARSLGDWTLVGCTVAPGFDFAGFELAAEGWSP